jgi:hypothetical protein
MPKTSGLLGWIQDLYRGGLRLIQALIKPKKSQKLTVLQRHQQETFKTSLRALKKAGLLPKEFDVNKAQSTRNLRRLISSNSDIVVGAAHTRKVTPDQAKELKKQGYKIKKDRVILPQGEDFRRGHIYTAPTKSRPSFRVRTVKMRGEYEETIKTIFRELGPRDFVAFELIPTDGSAALRSYDVYHSAEEMIRKFTGYGIIKDNEIRAIRIFRVANSSKYLAQSQARVDERRRKKREYQNQRARERRAAEKGMRVSRGH